MKAFLKEWGWFSLFILIILLSRLFIWSLVSVDGHSMDPTLQDSEHLIMLKTTSIERFDVVVASETDAAGKKKMIVKRLIGLPGDTIRFENDTLYINNEKVEEKYLQEYLTAFEKDRLQETYSYNLQFQQTAQTARAFTVDTTGNPNFTVQVPEGEYFLLGDDRLVSKDSRMVGTFKKDQLEGEIVFRILPFDRFGSINT
ncbi:signal peptidase I [Streptococcus cameli]